MPSGTDSRLISSANRKKKHGQSWFRIFEPALALTQDQEVIQAFVSHAADEVFPC
jgi:hypothetical protein